MLGSSLVQTSSFPKAMDDIKGGNIASHCCGRDDFLCRDDRDGFHVRMDNESMTRLRGVKSCRHCTGAEIEVSAMRTSDWCGILSILGILGIDATPVRGRKWMVVVRQEVGSRVLTANYRDDILNFCCCCCCCCLLLLTYYYLIIIMPLLS